MRMRVAPVPPSTSPVTPIAPAQKGLPLVPILVGAALLGLTFFLLSSPRHTYVYELVRGGGVVYIGISNGPADREGEHWRDGKVFDLPTMVVAGPMTWTEARQHEAERLADFRARNGGQNPRYNVKRNG